MNRKTGLRRVPLEPGNPPARRTPLARNAPWQAPRTAQGAREPGAKPKSAATGRGGTGQRKATPAGEFSDATKLLIRRRAGRGDIYEARCESCGTWLGEKGGEYSHRDARGMGGSRDPIVNGPAGGTLACGSGSLRTGCHGACENRDDEMNAMGFWLKNGQDLLATPIQLHGRGGGRESFYLAADGKGLDGTGYLYERPGAVAA